MKHTPGPWTYSGTAGHESHGQSIVIPEKDGRTVCLVYDGTANARLISAAPDLLVACLLFEELTGAGIAPGSEDLQTLQDAIKKASE